MVGWAGNLMCVAVFWIGEFTDLVVDLISVVKDER